MGTWPATNLLIRLDPRARGALQQQIYAGIRRAILDGVVAPGTRLPSSRAVAVDLGVSRTTAVLALEQLLAEGYLATRRGSGTFVAQDLPDDLPQGRAARPARSPRHPPLSRRGAALAATPTGGQRLAGPPRPFRIGTPGRGPLPRPALGAARHAPPPHHHRGPARLRRVGRHSRAARGHRRARPDRPRHRVRRRPGRDRGGRPAGPGPRLPPPARPGGPGLDGGPRLPGRAQRARRRRGPDPPGARRRRGPGRRGGRAGRRRRAPGLRDAVAPVPARRPDEPAAAARPPEVGEPLRGRGSSRTTTTASSGTGRGPSRASTASTSTAA